MEADRPVGADHFERALGTFTDEVQRDERARLRTERIDLRTVSGLSGTWAGTLVELAESSASVVVITRNGGHHRGRVLAVGPQLVVLSASLDAPRTLIAIGAIDAVRETGEGRVREIAEISGGPDLGSLLDEAGLERARASIVTAGGNGFAGRIMRVGTDQVTLRLDGDADSVTLPLSRVDEVVLDR